MSKRRNSSGSDPESSGKQLKDFLAKSKHSDQAADAFEKEALEGFAQLADEQEALDLKAALDDKMDDIFSGENKSNARNYWFAAAGFLLIVGLSVYFISNSSKDEKDLAVTTVKTTPQQQPAKNDIAPAPVTQPSESKKENVAETRKTNKAEPKNSAPVNANRSKSPVQRALTAPQKNEENADTNQINQPLALTSANAVSSVMEKSQSGVPAAEQSFKKYEAPSDKKVPETAHKMKVARSDASINAASGTADQTAMKDSEDEQTEIAGKSPAGVYYPAGEEKLNKIIKEKLAAETDRAKENAKSLKFEAVLFIDKTGQVKKVSLTRSFDLTGEQQKKVIKVLESLNNFKFSKANASESLREYKLFYGE